MPGGFARGSETGLEAARRETHEEVGLSLPEPIGRLAGRPAMRSLLRPFVIEPWVFVLEGDPVLDLDRDEVEEAFWLPWGTLRRRPGWGRQRLGRLPIVAPTRVIAGHRVWGLTGGIIDELAAIL